MKKLKSALLALLLVAPLSVQAGNTQVGTAPLLMSLGITNVYGQFPISDNSAIVATYSTINGAYLSGSLEASVSSVSYKKYFSDYARGGYWQAGAAYYNVVASTVTSVSGSAVVPILVGGYEWTIGESFVLGTEGGLGTGGGWGFFGINAAFQF